MPYLQENILIGGILVRDCQLKTGMVYFYQGNDSVAALQNQYRNVLLQQEERHGEEKRSLIESYLLKLSALEAQLVESQIRCEDLVQLQTVKKNKG